MNGARSTYMRKGYLLTALAAAVLLAASSGTALAQSVRFTTTEGSVTEGASALSTTPPLLEITIEAIGLPAGPAGIGEDLLPTERQEAIDALGTITIRDTGVGAETADVATMTGPPSFDDVFDTSDTVKVTIAPAEDDDWKDESFSLQLASTALINVGDPFEGTVKDNEAVPTASFSRTSIRINEESSTSVSVAIGVGTNETIPGDFAALLGNLKLIASPADAVSSAVCVADTDSAFVPLSIGGATQGAAPDDDTYTITKAIGTYGTAAAVTLTACGDMSGFRDTSITLSFDAASLKTTAGDITAGPPATITIESDESAPTVSFATTSVLIDEGSSNTVAILADGELGPEVGMVMVSMSGDAMLSLWQGDGMLEANAAGMYAIDLGGSANTILTISADSDAALEDGMTSTATVTIEEASGANIGDRDSLAVTVNGSTAVAALPLLGQLLLALFLMAGGARLYRRRQG